MEQAVALIYTPVVKGQHAFRLQTNGLANPETVAPAGVAQAASVKALAVTAWATLRRLRARALMRTGGD